MAKIPSNFTKFESPFKVLEDLDLNYQTPTSSLCVQKKLIFNGASSEKRENKMTFWRERFVINKHPLQITTLGLKTPPMIESPSIQPLAPIKPRKTINKMDLKPKKLVFKDVEKSELEMMKYPSKFSVKHDDSTANEKQCKLKIIRRKQTVSDEKENQRGLSSFQNRNAKSNDRMNQFNTDGSTSNPNNSSINSNNNNSNNNSNNNDNSLSLIQSKSLRIKGGLKHFRI